MGCWLGALHMLSASSNSSSKGPGECNKEGFTPGTLGAPGCGPSAGEHQAPEQSRSWNHGIVWAGKDPQNHQVQPFPQHCQGHH